MLDEPQSHEGDIRAASGERRAASSVGGRVSSSLTLPPTLLAARGSRLAARVSRLEYRTRFLAAPPAGILEQKRDCSQSMVTCGYLSYPAHPRCTQICVYPRAFMTLRVAQFSLKIAHLSFSMGPRGPRAYGLHPRLWLLFL